MLRKNIFKTLLAVAAVTAALGSYAFAGANTVTAKAAGQGADAIAGYTVGALAYTTIEAGGAIKIDKVSFTLTEAAGEVAATTAKARLDSSSAYTACTVLSGTWTCDFVTDVAVSAATSLDIYAAA